MKRIISIILLSLFVSLLQWVPSANAAVPSGVSNSTSCSSGNATVSFSVSSNGGSAITSWEYSFDGSSYATIPNASGNSGSYSVTSWYSSSFAPYIRARNNDGVSSAARNSSCGSINGRTSYAPTVLAATAPTGNTGSGQVLTSALTFNSQAVAVVKTYKWQLCSDAGASNCVDIPGATSATYTAGASDAGMYLRTVVTGTSTVDGVGQSTVGTSALTAQISEAAPGTPGTPTAVAGDGEVAITVVAPSSGGSPASYTVTALDNSGNVLSPGKTCTVTGATGSCVITGLTNGTAYKFSSTATNGAGTSSASAASTSATPAAPPPSITNITSSNANGSYNTGDVISIQVTFNQSVTVTGTPRLTLETGLTDQVLDYASGTGTNTLTFTYVIQTGDTSSDLTYVATNSLALNGGTIKNSSNLDAVLTLPSPAATGSLGANKAIVVDTTLPTITSFSSTTSDGSYKAGATINITATLSEAVTTAASITVTLDNGQTVVLTHSAETDTLTGSYTIGAGQSSSDLGITSFALTSAPADPAGNSMTSTTMPAGNISGTRAIVVDTTLPTLSSFTSTTSDGAYKVGSTINITATLSEAVSTAASITVTLDNGKTVVLTHNAVNNTLSGTYTVTTGDTSADLTVSSYALTSAPVDAAGNIMSDLSVPSGSNNIAGSKAIAVDTTAPSTPATPDLDAASDVGSSATDNITSDNTPTINVSGTFSGTAVVTATKQGATSVSCTISTNTCDLATLSDGTWSISVTDTDSAGNSTTSAAVSITVDTTAPLPTVAASSVTTASGLTVRSNEVGTAYLVKTTVTVTNLASITSAVDNSMNLVAIGAAGTDITMSTEGLLAGDYKLYVVDAAGNVSLASTNTVTVAVAAAPTATSTSAPTGTTTIGSTLTNAVTFNGVPTPTLSYQWKSCTSTTDTTTACTDISGATASTFIASAIDLVGKFIRVLVTAINTISPNGSALSSPTAAITAVAPGVPTVGTPTLGDLQINVPFTAPVSNGGSTIIKYQFSTDGGTNWLDRTDSSTVTSPIVIKFLSTDGTTPILAGTTYPIQIRAVNSATNPTGAATASVSVTAATAPGAPTAVSATATGQTTASVSFTAPASNGGSAITTYTVTSSPGGVTASGGTSPITVSGLTASTAYTFTVTATNVAATSVASTASTAITTNAPPPAPVCDAACEAAIKAAADKVIADKAAAAKVIADKVASDVVAKVVADTVAIDKSAAEAAAKAAVDKAIAAVLAKATADLAAANAAVVAKAAADAQQAAIVAAEKAAEALKSATTSAAAKATATATAVKAASTAANTVQEAATAAKTAATARAAATNAAKAVDIAIGAAGTQAAAAATAAQANAIAAAAKAAANKAAKTATDKAAAAKVASSNANQAAAIAAAKIVIEQKEAADAAAQAKIATDAALKATEEKIMAATEAQKSADAVVKALEEKIALAEASMKAKDIVERAAIDKKMEEVTAKVAAAQKNADAANAKAESTAVAAVQAESTAAVAVQAAQTQSSEAAAAKTDSINKTSTATKAAADAGIASKIASAAVAAAAKVPSKATPTPKPTATPSKNSAKATVTGLKPGQKVKVTVNVKGK